MDSKGKYIGRSNVSNGKFLPFGVGKRDCLGKALADRELTTFFVALMKNFDFEKDLVSLCYIESIFYSKLSKIKKIHSNFSKDCPLPSFHWSDDETNMGFLRKPPLFEVTLKRRQRIVTK